MRSIAKTFKVPFCVSTINADIFPHLIFHIGDKSSRQFIRIFMSLSVSCWVVSFSFLSVINSIVNDLPALHSTKQCLVTFPLYLSPHSGKVGIPPKFPSNRYLPQRWQFPKPIYSLTGALPHIIVVALQCFFLLLIRCKCCYLSITNQLSSIWPTFAFTDESGYTLGFRRKIAHNGLHAETGAFRMGVVSLPSERSTRFGNPAWPDVRTANFAAFGSRPGGALEERREPSEQRCAYARRCSEVSRPRRAA